MATTSAEHIPANGAAGLEKDISPAHLVILAEAAIQVSLISPTIHPLGSAVRTSRNDIASHCTCLYVYPGIWSSTRDLPVIYAGCD